MEKKRHEKVDARRYNNNATSHLLAKTLVDEVPDGECQRIDEGAGIYAKAGNYGNFKAGNIRQQLRGDIKSNDDDPHGGNR